VAFQNSYEIGEAVTQQTGIRFMDLMHLSVAKSVGVTDFYSADKRQCMAAHLVDFKVHDYSNAK
jgi:predicted nucleic acid-binding protein